MRKLPTFSELAQATAESGDSWSSFDRIIEGAVFIGSKGTKGEVAAAEEEELPF